MEDLTDDEQKLLDQMENPDEGGKDHYKWDEELQREILGLLLNDKYFLVQSMGLIKSSYFTNECHQYLSKIVFKHFDKYSILPSKSQMLHELKELVDHKETNIKVFYFSELNTVYEYYLPGVETRDYYLDRIINFAKGMSMKTAFGKCLEEFKKAPEEETTWVKIESIIRDAMSVDRNVDIGLDYFKTFEERYERMKLKKESGDYFVTGFKTIDDSLSGGGLSRGEIGSVVGLPGTGKSIFLVNACLANMHRGKKVLYLSLEIDMDKCAERFDAQFANPSPFGDGHSGVTIKNLYDKKELVFNSLREYVADKDDQRLLIVKQFPGGDMDMTKFRAYYSQLALVGFNPDLIIIDYVGEMKDYPGMPTWESRQKLVRDLRGFAVESKTCILTAMQPDGRSRETIKLGGVIDDDNLADSKGQNRPLDALWSINQLQDEKDCGLARIFVIKHRDGKSRFTTHVEFNYDTLKMREVSENKYKSTYTAYKNAKTTTVADQMAKIESIIPNSKKTAAIASFANDVGYNDVEDVE